VKEFGISIVGAGRVGRALGRRLREQGWRIHGVVTRSEATAKRAVRFIGGGSAHAVISHGVFDAPVILIAVPESEIPQVVAELSSFGQPVLRGKIALHTSGALGSEVLAPLHSFGANAGSIHPLQTFSGVGTPPLEGRVFAIEGDRAAIKIARAITRALGGLPVLLSAKSKPLYHAAAVISAGHVLALMEAAIQIFASLGMKRREALKALLPLTRQVMQNLERVGPRSAWTGPLARGDYAVLAMHEDALQSSPVEYLDAYRAVNRLAGRVLARDAQAALIELGKVSRKSSSQLKARGTTA
jgi:predicted short-subunit dehydrogenase-like oxidoreductase (DUF2520 family)